jgi:hypothetical protein
MSLQVLQALAIAAGFLLLAGIMEWQKRRDKKRGRPW